MLSLGAFDRKASRRSVTVCRTAAASGETVIIAPLIADRASLVASRRLWEESMKATRFALAMVGGLSVFGGLAVVASTPAEAWYCTARGTTGAIGWGAHVYLATAQGIALRQCALRTPRGAACFIVNCR